MRNQYNVEAQGCWWSINKTIYLRSFKIFFAVRAANGLKAGEEAVDEVIEDEITHKLGEDLLQSLERKFQVDLERCEKFIIAYTRNG